MTKIAQTFWLEYQQKKRCLSQTTVPLLCWMIQVALLILCIQPLDRLWDYQKVGLLWFTLVFTLLRSVQESFAQQNVTTWYEHNHFSSQQQGLWWRTKLAALWCVHAKSCLIAVPTACLLLGVSLDAVGQIVMLWLLVSPWYYLLWLCLHSISVGVKYGTIMVTVLMVPWMIPSILWVHEIILAHQLQTQTSGYWACILGTTTVGVVWLPKIVDAIMQEVYYRLRCEP